MLSVFTLKETIYTKTWAEPLPNFSTSGLSAPLKTSSLKLPVFTIFEDEVTFLHTWDQDLSCNHEFFFHSTLKEIIYTKFIQSYVTRSLNRRYEEASFFIFHHSVTLVGAMPRYMTFFVVLFKTMFRHWDCFMSSASTDGKDGNGLKLWKVQLCVQKIVKKIIMVCAPWWNWFDIFFITLQEHSGYGLIRHWVMTITQNWPKTAKSTWHSHLKKKKSLRSEKAEKDV